MPQFGLRVWIAETACPQCGEKSKVVLRRHREDKHVQPGQPLVKEPCFRCTLAPLDEVQRDYYRRLWRSLWLEAGGAESELPAAVNPGGAPPPPRPVAPRPAPMPLKHLPRLAAGTPSFAFRAKEVPPLPGSSPKPLRLLFATHDLSLSGAPIILANLVPGLRGIEPVVYSPTPGPLKQRFDLAGVRVVYDLDLTAADLVVCNTLLSAGVVERCREEGKRCVWMIHEHRPDTCNTMSAVCAAIPYPERVIFPHASTAENYAPFRKEGVSLIPTVIPPVPVRDRVEARRELGVKEQHFVAVTMGQAEERKGQEDLHAVEGLKNLKKFFVHNDPDPWPYYAGADVYVSTSREECFPLALQEARRFGLPCIATAIPGNLAVLAGPDEALVYRPGDVEGLTCHLRTLQGDAEARRRYASAPSTLPAWSTTLEQYEKEFAAAAGRGWDQPLTVVWHCCTMGRLWPAIAREQLQTLADAGLNRVLATIVGPDVEQLQTIAREKGVDLVLCDARERFDHYERPALELIERLVRPSENPVLYIHMKGISHENPDEMYHAWRRLMMSALVTRWRDVVQQLNTHDAAGVNWWTNAAVHHFSGNFWMARADWLRGLPTIKEYWTDRYSAERWIGSRPGCRALSLLCEDAVFWDRDRTLFNRLVAEHVPAGQGAAS